MNILKILTLAVTLPMLVNTGLNAQVHDTSWREMVNRKEGPWFASPEAKEIAENVLLYQRNIGGWPKNVQMQKELTDQEKQSLISLKNDSHHVTTDNGATTQEMLFLSKMYRQNPDERYRKAFLSGLDYLLEAQYENGGWPQFYPLREGYYAHITYNDNAMVNIMHVLKELIERTGYYSIQPDMATLERARSAFEKGIDCILKTQYVQHGKLTSWCAQYEEHTLAPAKARAYELPSLSGKESAQIVLLLMSIDNPSDKIIRAVDSAVEWFEKVKISGMSVDRTYNQNGRVVDKKLVAQADAPPIWARFMDLEDNTPFFCDRDGIKKATLAEIGPERRNGYAWYTDEPKEVLEKYSKWKEKQLHPALKTEK